MDMAHFAENPLEFSEIAYTNAGSGVPR